MIRTYPFSKGLRNSVSSSLRMAVSISSKVSNSATPTGSPRSRNTSVNEGLTYCRKKSYTWRGSRTVHGVGATCNRASAGACGRCTQCPFIPCMRRHPTRGGAPCCACAGGDRLNIHQVGRRGVARTLRSCQLADGGRPLTRTRNCEPPPRRATGPACMDGPRGLPPRASSTRSVVP